MVTGIAHIRWLVLSLAGLMALLAADAAAADGLPTTEPSEPVAALATEPPRLTRTDTPNVAIPSPPGRRTDLNELTYRRWTSAEGAGFGIGVGSVALIDRPSSAALGGRLGDAPSATLASGTVLMLGLRFKASERSSLYADASRLHGLGLDGDERVVGKVGIEFKAAQSRWNIAYGGLGLRLAGESRMTVKLRRGGIGVFMRREF